MKKKKMLVCELCACGWGLSFCFILLAIDTVNSIRSQAMMIEMNDVTKLFYSVSAVWITADLILDDFDGNRCQPKPWPPSHHHTHQRRWSVSWHEKVKMWPLFVYSKWLMFVWLKNHVVGQYLIQNLLPCHRNVAEISLCRNCWQKRFLFVDNSWWLFVLRLFFQTYLNFFFYWIRSVENNRGKCALFK